MKTLVLGSGGREHAIAWSLARSPRIDTVFCGPGNGAMSRDVQIVPVDATDPEGIEKAIQFAKDEGIDLTVVGPEASLVLGVVDRFEEEGLRIFGPNQAAAQLEGSKVFCKDFFKRHNIQTAAYESFDAADDALRHLESRQAPVVVKADGLAAGKGVYVSRTRQEAEQAVREIMVGRRFGDAGDRIVIEDCMSGPELTLICLTDGTTILPLETAQDYKPAFDGNEGPNTGGMGSYSPNMPLSSDLVQQILETVVQPTIQGLRDEGIAYRGALYAGLMLTDDGPKMLEYNVRFGDPECQAILMRLKSDFATLLEACIDGTLSDVTPVWDERPSVCLITASDGYPGSFEKGFPITGLDEAEADPDVKVFSAGTTRSESGDIVTSGGRVLGVTALGDSLEAARQRAYEAAGKIQFEGLRTRSDIGIPY
jgi:phosphoribosylamine--glycine ligase